MLYRATTQRVLIGICSLLTLFSAFQTEKTALFWLLICIGLVQCSFLMICYRLRIEHATICYTICLWKWTLYKKQLVPHMITFIRFKRSNWQSKCATIAHKGIPLRIAHFTPVAVYDDLYAFCLRHDIPHKKTAQYMIVEKIHAKKG